MVERYRAKAEHRKERSVKCMMIGLLCGVFGYFVAVEAGYFLTMLLSSNVHDRSLVAAMNSAFVFGPGGAVAAFAVAVALVMRRRRLAAVR